MQRDHILWWLGVLLAALLSVGSTSAYVVENLTYSCTNGHCITGDPFNLTVGFYKKAGKDDMELTSFYLNDNVTGATFVHYNETFQVHPKRPFEIEIGSIVPLPNRGRYFLFYPCVDIRVKRIDWELITANSNEARDLMTQDNARIKQRVYIYCYDNKTFSVPITNCFENTDCPEDQFCDSDFCAQRVCRPCQYLFNHTCHWYECCQTTECARDEVCTNHTCTKLTCGLTAIIGLHECKELNCTDDEDIINSTCQKLNCSEDEYPLNHECVQLACRENEYIDDRACKLLTCALDEVARNHTCQQISCADDATATNHKCVQLNCAFYQGAFNHSCATDTMVTVYVSSETVAIALILFVSLMIVYRYEVKRRSFLRVR